jgi:hypothetical protein
VGLSLEMYEYVESEHKEAQEALRRASLKVASAGDDPESEEYAVARDEQAAVIERYLLIGEAIVIDNPDPQRADYTGHSIGASDLKEALQDAIGGYDRSHIGEDGVSSDQEFTPQWVASTHEDLAKALADYYSCKVIPLSEVPV